MIRQKLHQARQMFLSVFAGVACLAAPLHAELIWEQSLFEVKAKEGAKEERFTYRFENKGDYTVTIQKIQTSCGCTTAELGKKEYKPGERGELTAIFKFGNRKGLQEKSISVEIDDAAHPSAVLLLRVELPDILQIKKRELSWEVGDPLEEQTFELVLKDPKRAKVTGIRPLAGFEVHLQEDQPGRSYQIVVKPVSTDAPKKGIVTVEVEEANGEKRSFPLKAMIQ